MGKKQVRTEMKPLDPRAWKAPRRVMTTTPASRYVRRSALFKISGTWPLPVGARAQAEVTRAREVDRDCPPVPPDDLSERQVFMVNRLIAERGWQLVKYPD